MRQKRILLPVVLMIMLLVLGAGTMQACAGTVAKIGSKSYSSFNAALKAVRPGQTIKLTKNCSFHTNPTVFSSVGFDKKFTLDLNRKKLTCTDMYSKKYQTSATVSVTKKVTIKNGTLVGGFSLRDGGSISATKVTFGLNKKDNYQLIQLFDKSTAVLKNCKGKRMELFCSGKNTKMTIKDCTISERCKIIAGQGYDESNSNPCEVTIDGGTYVYQSGNAGADQGMLNVGPKGKLTIKKGKFYTYNTSIWTFLNHGKMIIKGGDFLNTVNYVGYNLGILDLSGGTLKSTADYAGCVSNSAGATLNMTGGRVTTTGVYSVAIFDDGDGSGVHISGGVLEPAA